MTTSQNFWRDGKRTSENGCCSSVEPCSWQKTSPYTLCPTCSGQPSTPPAPATLSGQQGGAVLAGDRVEAALDQWFANPRWREVYRDGPDVRAYMARAIAASDRARLAEQPAPAGLRDPSPIDQPISDFDFTPAAFVSKLREAVAAGQSLTIILPEQATRDMLAWAETAPAGTGADGVEGLRPGLEKALEIVRAEMETASSHSGSYQRLGSVGLALRAALDGASGQEGRS